MKMPFIFASVVARSIARSTSRSVTAVCCDSSFKPANNWDALSSGGASVIGTARSRTKRELLSTVGFFSERPIRATRAKHPTRATPTSKRTAKNAPKKDPKNDFIYLKNCGVFYPYLMRRHRGQIFVLCPKVAPVPFGLVTGARSNSLPHFANAVNRAFRTTGCSQDRTRLVLRCVLLENQ